MGIELARNGAVSWSPKMGKLGCYRGTWTLIIPRDDLVREGKVYLRVDIAPELDTPTGLHRSPGRTEAGANVRRDDPELHVFDVRWRSHPVNVDRIQMAPNQSPIVTLWMTPTAESLGAADLKAGWREVDRGIMELVTPLKSPDIHLDETECGTTTRSGDRGLPLLPDHRSQISPH